MDRKREEEYDEMTQRLLEQPVLVIDFLPERVPAERAEAYFALERFCLEPERLNGLYRRFARLLAKLSAYADMAAWDGETWTEPVRPDELTHKIEACAGGGFLNVLLPGEDSLVTLSSGDLYMTLYRPSENIKRIAAALAASEGLFAREGTAPDGAASDRDRDGKGGKMR